MKRFSLCLLFVAFASRGEAQTCTHRTGPTTCQGGVTWTPSPPVTTDGNGDPIPPIPIASYQVQLDNNAPITVSPTGPACGNTPPPCAQIQITGLGNHVVTVIATRASTGLTDPGPWSSTPTTHQFALVKKWLGLKLVIQQ